MKVKDLIARTDKENPRRADIIAMRSLLDTGEGQALVKANDPVRRTIDAFVRSYSTSAFQRETIERNIEVKRKELNYDDEHPLIRILIDQLLLCQIRLNQFEVVHGNRTNESHTFTAGAYYEKRLSMTHRRFLRAVETFAKVKRLLSDAEYREQQARHKRGQSTLVTQKLIKGLTGG